MSWTRLLKKGHRGKLLKNLRFVSGHAFRRCGAGIEFFSSPLYPITVVCSGRIL